MKMTQLTRISTAAATILAVQALTIRHSAVADTPTRTPSVPVETATGQLSNIILWVPDVSEAARFYTAVFGIRTHVEMNFGSYRWLELDTGAMKLSFASESQAGELFGTRYRRNRAGQDPQAIGLSFRVSDTAARYAAALAAGATSVHGPKPEPWGPTIARIRDPNGVVIDLIGPPAHSK